MEQGSLLEVISCSFISMDLDSLFLLKPSRQEETKRREFNVSISLMGI
jgi:hypothetical protein